MANTSQYQAYATKMAKKYRLPVPVFHALVGAESGWDAEIKSPVGATGLTQLMPGTAKTLGVDPLNWKQNLEGGARYLRQQIDRFGTLRLGLAAYNAGPGNVEKYGGVPPFAETQRYVRKIMKASPTDVQQVKRNPRKQATITTAPPPAALLSQVGSLSAPTGLTGDAGAAAAFESLGRIGRGESPTHTLTNLVDAVSSTPTPVVAPREAISQPLPPASSPPVPPASSARPVGQSSRPQPLKGGGGWGGSYNVAHSLAKLGFSQGLQAVSEKRERQSTTTGGVSDHWEGKKNAYAFDLSNGSAPTEEMDKAAIAIAKRLGVKYDGKTPLVLTVKVNGYRVQVLYRTQVGGNHDNHIHVGVEKVA